MFEYQVKILTVPAPPDRLAQRNWSMLGTWTGLYLYHALHQGRHFSYKMNPSLSFPRQPTTIVQQENSIHLIKHQICVSVCVFIYMCENVWPEIHLQSIAVFIVNQELTGLISLPSELHLTLYCYLTSIVFSLIVIAFVYANVHNMCSCLRLGGVTLVLECCFRNGGAEQHRDKQINSDHLSVLPCRFGFCFTGRIIADELSIVAVRLVASCRPTGRSWPCCSPNVQSSRGRRGRSVVLVGDVLLPGRFLGHPDLTPQMFRLMRTATSRWQNQQYQQLPVLLLLLLFFSFLSDVHGLVF